jgi:tetratricopeptide (TPR) repeat protein
MRRLLLALALFVPTVVPTVAHARVSPAQRALEHGNELLTMSRPVDALPYLQQAVALAPHNANARFSYASALRATGQLEPAIREYRESILLTPAKAPERVRANSLYGIALAQDATGDPQAATTAWLEYLRYAGNNPGEQEAVRIARYRLEYSQAQLAAMQPPRLGTPTAARPTIRQ